MTRRDEISAISQFDPFEFNTSIKPTSKWRDKQTSATSNNMMQDYSQHQVADGLRTAEHQVQRLQALRMTEGKAAEDNMAGEETPH